MPTKPTAGKGKRPAAKKVARKKKSPSPKQGAQAKKPSGSQASRIKALGKHINSILPQFGFTGHKTVFLGLEHTKALKAPLDGCHCQPGEVCVLDPTTGLPHCVPKSTITGA
jgi:hypothetical protein